MRADLTAALVLSNARKTLRDLIAAFEREVSTRRCAESSLRALNRARRALALIDAFAGPPKPPGELRVTRQAVESIEAERPGMTVIQGGRA